MKKNFVPVLLIVFAALATVAWLFALSSGPKDNIAVHGVGVEKKLEDLTVSSKEKNQAAVLSTTETESSDKMTASFQTSMQSEFQKCFKKESKAQNLESLKTILLQQKDFSSPSLSEESFELVTDDHKNLVVQHIPMEDSSNKVRVFSINPEDGMPDRIKDFPQNSAEISLRLKGALSLGVVKSKTTSTTQTSYDGSMLSIDEKDNKVVRLHLITTAFDFECKDQSCQCLKKE